MSLLFLTTWIYWFFVIFIYNNFIQFSIRLQIIITICLLTFGIFVEFFFRIRAEIIFFVKIFLFLMILYFNSIFLKLFIFLLAGYVYVTLFNMICIVRLDKLRKTKSDGNISKNLADKNFNRKSCHF